MSSVEKRLAYKQADYKSDVKPIWCPGCGDYHVLMSFRPRLRAIGPAARANRRHFRHRLLVAHSRLHQLLRLSRRARPLAGARRRAEGDAARPHRRGRQRRRRRLLDRRQPFPARLPPQHRHDLCRHGQPHLRHDQGPALADHRAGIRHRAVAGRHAGAAVPSAGGRARLGRELHRPLLLRRSERDRRRAGGSDQASRISRSSKSSAPA